MLCGDFGLPAPFQSSLWWLLCSCNSFSENAWSSFQPGLVCQPWKLQDARAEPWQLVSAHCHSHAQDRVLQAPGGWPPPPCSGQPFPLRPMECSSRSHMTPFWLSPWLSLVGHSLSSASFLSTGAPLTVLQEKPLWAGWFHFKLLITNLN